MDGLLEWLVQIESDLQVSLNGGAKDNLGNIYITGSFRDTITFNSMTGPSIDLVTASGNFDVYIAKYLNDGTPVWATRGGSLGSFFSESIAIKRA